MRAITQASNSAISDTTSTVIHSWKVEWRTQASLGSRFFRAMGEYCEAMAHRISCESSGSGWAALAVRLSMACNAMKDSAEFAQRYCSPDESQSINTVYQRLMKEYSSVDEANRTAYFESLPDVGSMSPIPAVEVARAIELPSDDSLVVAAAARPAMLNALRPRWVAQAVLWWNDTVRDIQNTAKSASAASGSRWRAALSAHGLPGALECLRTGTAVPPSLQKQLVSIRAATAGNVSTLEVLFSARRSSDDAVTRCSDLLEEVEKLLVDDEAECESFITKMGMISAAEIDRFAISEQNEGTSVLRTELHTRRVRLFESHRSARDSDAPMNSQIDSTELAEGLSLLPKAESELKRIDENIAVSPTLSDKLGPLESRLAELNTLEDSRQKRLVDLSILVESDVASALMTRAENGSLVQEHFYDPARSLEPEVQQAKVIVDELGELETKQKFFVENVLNDSELLFRAVDRDPNSQERRQLISKLEKTVNSFFTLKAALRASQVFQHSLQQSARLLRQHTEDFIFASKSRRLAFEEIIDDWLFKEAQSSSDAELAKALHEQGSVTHHVAESKNEATADALSIGELKDMKESSLHKSCEDKKGAHKTDALSPVDHDTHCGASTSNSNSMSRIESGTSAPPIPSIPQDQAITQLASMGFGTESARRALIANDWDTEAAINCLLSEP